MSIPTRPGGQVVWCANIVNNSPTGGPNREAYDSRYGTDGWAYAEHPPYQVFNEWNYNVYQNLEWIATSLTQLDSDVSALGGGKYVDATLSVAVDQPPFLSPLTVFQTLWYNYKTLQELWLVQIL